MVGWFSVDAISTKKVSQIVDVSWPNCDMYIPPAQQGIVGVNGGLAFRPNPCLSSEAKNFKHPSVYLNSGYPGPRIANAQQLRPKDCAAQDKKCLAYNYGYNSGRYAADYALNSGVIAKYWWIDVETENSWDKDYRVNRAALRGLFDALIRIVGQDNVGFYSYPGQWDSLTYDWRSNSPVWMATGSSNLGDAIKACHNSSFTGGPIILGQYTPSLDMNVACLAF